MNDSPSEASIVVEHEYDAKMSPSVALIRAICVCEDVDPIDAPDDLGFALYDYVDPTALDALFADDSGDGDTVVTFAIDDAYLVEVDDDHITIGCDQSS